MPRGQYDRTAAKAKRDMADHYETDAAASEDVTAFSGSQSRLTPAANTILEQLQAKLDAATELNARYARLLKQHGLWLDE
jgi:hypothetical protein